MTILLKFFCSCNDFTFTFLLQTDADRRFLAAKGSVPIGIGKNSHIKRAIIDKNARIGDNVKVIVLLLNPLPPPPTNSSLSYQIGASSHYVY